MSNCIVHFGMHKTGTTSIQASLYRGLADSRFHYADFGTPNCGIAISNGFRQKPGRYHRNVRKGVDESQLGSLVAQARRVLAEQIEEAGARTLIISGEDICMLGIRAARSFVDFLCQRGRDVRAVGYVRDPCGYMESMFQQRLKGGSKSLNLAALFPRYRTMLGKFEEILGRESVDLWRYAPDFFAHGCVVQDFCRRLGIDFDARNVVRRNSSLSMPAVQLLFFYRNYGPPLSSGAEAMRRNRKLIRRLRALEGPSLRFRRTLVEPLLRSNKDSIDWVNARMDSPFPDLADRDAAHALGDRDELLRIPVETVDWLCSQPAVRKMSARLAADPRQIIQALERLSR